MVISYLLFVANNNLSDILVIDVWVGVSLKDQHSIFQELQVKQYDLYKKTYHK